MLKINAPLKLKEEVIPLIKAGADELYCGYLAPEWVTRYTGFEFERKGTGSNFTDLKELKEAVDLAHQENVPVYLTLNGLYVNQQYPLLLKIIDQLSLIDFDAYIVANIGLLLTLKQRGFKKQIHISTGGTVFNSEAVDFYKSLGASKIVLDRQVTLQSMRELSEQHPGVDFEVFILNTLCVHIDGFCTFMHTYDRESAEDVSKKDWPKDEKLHVVVAYDPEAEADACCLKYSVEVFDSQLEKKINAPKITPAFYKHLVDGVECGVCAMYDIARTKVKTVKIVGRHLGPEVKLLSTKLVRAALDILKNNPEITRQDFIHKCQELYREIAGYKQNCRGNNCYHPGVLNY